MAHWSVFWLVAVASEVGTAKPDVAGSIFRKYTLMGTATPWESKADIEVPYVPMGVGGVTVDAILARASKLNSAFTDVVCLAGMGAPVGTVAFSKVSPPLRPVTGSN